MFVLLLPRSVSTVKQRIEKITVNNENQVIPIFYTDTLLIL